MAITVDQIPSTLTTLQELSNLLNDTRMLLNQAKELSDKNWTVDIGSRFSLPVTITPEQRLAMVAKYDDFKAQLVSKFQTLP